MGLARLSLAVTSDDGKFQDSGRRHICCRRRFPILALKDSLPNSLPVAPDLSHDRLAQRTSGSFSNGMEARSVLYCLLLASDVAAFCGRRNEPFLDRPAGNLRISRTDCA